MTPGPGPESHDGGPDRRRAIFINYRREDSGGQARALLYALERAFPDQVFMDVKGLAPGVNYLEEIEHTVGHCQVVLVLIGKAWVNVVDAAGRRRIKDPRDVVALEIGTALRRPDVLVVPVLIGGATVPAEEDLPESLHGLLSRQCLQITEQDWDHNVQQLIESLRPRLSRGRVGGRDRLRIGIAVAGVIAAIGVGAVLLLRPGGKPPSAGAAAPAEVAVAAPLPAQAPREAAVPQKAPVQQAPVQQAPVQKAPVQKARKSVAAAPGTEQPAPPPASPPEQRLAFATSEVVSFNQYLGSPEARGHGRSLVGNAKWYLGPRGAFTFAPADQAPGFFPMTVRATRDGDRVSFEGVQVARATDGKAYVRISGHMLLGKTPPVLTVDLEFGRVPGEDVTDVQPTFKAQARLQLSAQ